MNTKKSNFFFFTTQKKAFPDDFHLRTLEPFLGACAQLQPGVQIKVILVSLLDRLADFASKGEQIPADIDVFAIFSSQVSKVVAVRRTNEPSQL